MATVMLPLETVLSRSVVRVALLWAATVAVILPTRADAEVRIETFADLSGTREIVLDRDDVASRYEATADGEHLRITSENGASMLAFPAEINFNETPCLTWRWRVVTDVAGEDVRTREGDDAAIRLYVSFRPPLAERPLPERVWAAVQRRRFGELPPDRGIALVGSGRSYPEGIYVSPFTDRSFNVIAPAGPGSAGSAGSDGWREQRVDIRALHRQLFGEDPPEAAFLSVMGDSDNSGGRSVALAAWGCPSGFSIQRTARALPRVCSTFLQPGMTAVTAGLRRGHARAHSAIGAPSGSSVDRIVSISASIVARVSRSMPERQSFSGKTASAPYFPVRKPLARGTRARTPMFAFRAASKTSPSGPRSRRL